MRSRVPIGLSDFRELREPGLEYIDKSDLIVRMLDRPGEQVLLFPRPRRFGVAVVHKGPLWLGGRSGSAAARSARLAARSRDFRVPSGISSTAAASASVRPFRMTLSITS